MKTVSIILIIVYILVLPIAIKMTIIHRFRPQYDALGLTDKLPWYLHFLSIWLIMPWFLIKYYIIDRING